MDSSRTEAPARTDPGAAADEHRRQQRRQAERHAEARRPLVEQAERVMNESRPTPTQEENDLIKTGALHPDDKEEPDSPTMPPLHVQHAHMAEATRTDSGEDERRARDRATARAGRQAAPEHATGDAAGATGGTQTASTGGKPPAPADASGSKPAEPGKV